MTTSRKAFLLMEINAYRIETPACLCSSACRGPCGGALAERVGPRRLQMARVLSSRSPSSGCSGRVGLGPGNRMSCMCPDLMSVIQGLVVALMYPAVPIYPCEIADPRGRGTWAALSSGVLPMVTLLPGVLGAWPWLHESPLLVSEAREETPAAIEVLQCLECPQKKYQVSPLCAARETKKDRTQMASRIPESPEKVFFVSLIVSVMVFVMAQIHGPVVISANAVSYIPIGRSRTSPSLSSILVGTTRLTFCGLGSSCCIACLGTLLVVGNVMAGVALIAIATFFFMRSREYDPSRLKWLPLGNLMLYMVPILHWHWAGELSAARGGASRGPLRSAGSSVAATCFFASIFLVTKTFDDVEVHSACTVSFMHMHLAALCFVFLFYLGYPNKDRSPLGK
ncbi:facilitated trehalose transporter Tret1-like [Penaeus monodon]|uniref:facilitated trehalose transporter Tret1-like n=1 Tax=Penaeus monodon TaxID=6687 RepID=UPI0018A789F0|nr:facilitated trehalose transporter Tret1-like [Penaeus monodon]